MEDLPHDLRSRTAYRIARGEAARLAEMATFDHGWDRDFAAGSAARPTRSRKK
jgi:hypothetical protein